MCSQLQGLNRKGGFQWTRGVISSCDCHETKKEKLTKKTKQNRFSQCQRENENMAMFSEQPSSSRLRKLKAQNIRLSFGFYIWSLLGNCRNKKGNCQQIVLTHRSLCTVNQNKTGFPKTGGSHSQEKL